MLCVCVRVRLLLAPRRLHRASLLSTLHGSGNGPLCALGVHTFLSGENFHPGRRGGRRGRRGAISIFLRDIKKCMLRGAMHISGWTHAILRQRTKRNLHKEDRAPVHATQKIKRWTNRRLVQVWEPATQPLAEKACIGAQWNATEHNGIPAFSGAQKRAELLRDPCVLRGPHKTGQNQK